MLGSFVLGTAQASGSATQSINFRFGPLSRAGLSSDWVALSAPTAGRTTLGAQGVGALHYARNGSVRLLVGAAHTLPAGSALEVGLPGAGPAVRLGALHTDLSGSGLLPSGDHRLQLQYALTGRVSGAALPAVVYTLLDP